MITWLYIREQIKKILYRYKIRKKTKRGELDEEFKKQMKDAYDTGLQQGANIGKVL